MAPALLLRAINCRAAEPDCSGHRLLVSCATGSAWLTGVFTPRAVQRGIYCRPELPMARSRCLSCTRRLKDKQFSGLSLKGSSPNIIFPCERMCAAISSNRVISFVSCKAKAEGKKKKKKRRKGLYIITHKSAFLLHV